jgi:hypothetical protein
MIVIAIIALVCAHVASGRFGASTLIPIEFGILSVAPIWLSAILIFQPPAKALRLLKGAAITTGLLTVPSCLGAATDGFAYQYDCVFLFVGSYWLTMSFGIGYLASRLRHGPG